MLPTGHLIPAWYLSLMASLLPILGALPAEHPRAQHVHTLSKRQTHQWLNPCANPAHRASAEVAGVLRALIHSNFRSKEISPSDFAQRLSGRLEDTAEVVQHVKNHIRNYYGGNRAHIAGLERKQPIQALQPTTGGATAELQLKRAYESLARMAIFMEKMKDDLAGSGHRGSAALLRKLEVLGHGGSWNGGVHTAGIYPLLCEIIRVGPHEVTGLDSSIIPGHLRKPADLGEHHDRDYEIMHNMQRLVARLRTELDAV